MTLSSLCDAARQGMQNVAEQYEAVIGLEIHAELLTESKMFCGCRVVDSVTAAPNTAVCPVCLGMPGMLPVINRRAVAFARAPTLRLQWRDDLGRCAAPVAGKAGFKNINVIVQV